LISFAIALLVVVFGRQTWEWTQQLTVPKACAALLIGGAGLVALLTQDYNPFIYFIF
jgi:alginate O-acetyltransferase complex protein AlgI